MKIAFLCLAHGDLSWLSKLSHYYLSDNDGLFIHVDKRSGFIDKSLFHSTTVFVGEDKRCESRWGTFGLVEATLALLDLALTHDQYDRLILVSGGDLPVLSKKALKALVANDKEYIAIWGQASCDNRHAPTQRAIRYKDFYARHHYNYALCNPGEAFASKSRLRIHGMRLINFLIGLLPCSEQEIFSTYYKGSQWWCLSKAAAKYILDNYHSNQKTHKKRFSLMHAPDEIYFHSVLMHSDFAHHISQEDPFASCAHGIHYIDWGKGALSMQPITPGNVQGAVDAGCGFARKIDMAYCDEFSSLVDALQ